ncbi:MAG TPA: hypothetical protein VN901_07440 [Candidatus Acidoferrales bacterium]|nr:hypothetical protein [Candidatus Acidoferrales bacterium]
MSEPLVVAYALPPGPAVQPPVKRGARPVAGVNWKGTQSLLLLLNAPINRNFLPSHRI